MRCGCGGEEKREVGEGKDVDCKGSGSEVLVEFKFAKWGFYSERAGKLICGFRTVRCLKLKF